jgi:hypothetical protein
LPPGLSQRLAQMKVDQAHGGPMQRFGADIIGLHFFQLPVTRSRPDDRHIVEADVTAFGNQANQQLNLVSGIGLGDRTPGIEPRETSEKIGPTLDFQQQIAQMAALDHLAQSVL